MSTKKIIQELTQDLTQPRLLTDQVLEQLAGQYNTPPEDLANFITNQFPQLEDYAVDLTFSSLFTPTQEESARYASLLADGVVNQSDLMSIKSHLLGLNLSASFTTPAGESHAYPLHEVLQDRFVDRLPLDKPLPEGIFALIQAHVPTEHQGVVNLLSRNSDWMSPWRQALLKAFLTLFGGQTTFAQDKFEYLCEFLHTYRPNHLEDMAQKLQRVIESCKTDLEALPGRSFHDEHLKVSYADHDTHLASAKSESNKVKSFYEHLIAMATGLLSDLETLKQSHPDAVEAIQHALDAEAQPSAV
jgi:hypothetical protein